MRDVKEFEKTVKNLMLYRTVANQTLNIKTRNGRYGLKTRSSFHFAAIKRKLRFCRFGFLIAHTYDILTVSTCVAFADDDDEEEFLKTFLKSRTYFCGFSSLKGSRGFVQLFIF